MKIADFAAAHRVLSTYMAHTTLPGAYTLDRQKRLLDFLDNPQDQLCVVHVAGTSGKTSTAYYTAALLQAAGYRVGLTVSPHVEEVNERVQINLTPLPEQEFCPALGEFVDLVEASGVAPTYFELLTAFAFWYFARQGVDYAVVEVGLGGLLDSTNVISRPDKVCVITDIGFDHMHILGRTLHEIATQKAGIIQLRNTAVCYEQSDEVMSSIRPRAARMQADLHTLTQPPTPESLNFLPLFQQRNFALAEAAANIVLEHAKHAPLSDAQVLEAARTQVPGRMETFTVRGKTLILDGAHNAQKLHALAASIRQRYPEQRAAALISFVAHRSGHMDDGLAELASFTTHAIVTSLHSASGAPAHSVPLEMVRAACVRAGIMAVDTQASPTKALEALLARPEPLLLVTGSLYLLGHIRPRLAQSV